MENNRENNEETKRNGLISIDKDLIERYMKTWKVSREEAEGRLKQMLDNNDAAKKIPSPENLFPEPVGEVSRKIQDINQALLSSAYTRRLLDAPPEEVAALRARIENLDRIAGELKSGLEDQIRRITEVLENKQRKETREELLKELDSKINPLSEELKKLREKLEKAEKGEVVEGGGGKPVEPGKVLEEAQKIAEEAKTWLGRMGYRVEPERLTEEEVLSRLPAEELKKRLEKVGYRIVGEPIAWEEHQRRLDEERRKAREEALDDKRLDMVADLIRESVSKLIEMFRPAVEALFTAPEGERPSSSSSGESGSPGS